MSPFVRDSNPGIKPGSVAALNGFKMNVIILTFDHVTHKILWVSTDTEEFQPCVCDKFAESFVCCNSHAMSILEKLLPKRNVWLNVTYSISGQICVKRLSGHTAAPNNHDDNIHLRTHVPSHHIHRKFLNVLLWGHIWHTLLQVEVE